MCFAIRRRGAIVLGLACLALLARAAAADPQGFRPAADGGPVSTANEGARCVGPGYDDTAAFQAALDTGRTVYAPALGGSCHITHPLVMRTPGQIIHGDGRARTRLVIEPGFSGAGVFVAATGGPGPIWRDFLVEFMQPDIDDRAKLVHYPPAFLARATPGFQIDHVGCYAATTCIDMTGNSGNSTITDFQMSAFETGIDIDGALDSVRIIDPHWWPFDLSSNQQLLFRNQGPGRSIALRVGRMDDLIIRGGMFLGGLALYAYSGKSGAAFGTITGTDFDSTSAIFLAAGSIQVSGVEFTLGDPSAQAVHQTGGSMTIASALFFVGTHLRMPMVSLSGGELSISDSNINTLQFDVTSVSEDGAQSVLTLNGNVFKRTPSRPYAAPTIDLQGGRTIAIGNYTTDKGSGAGTFMQIRNDNPFNRVIGNASPGWPNYAPLRRTGFYLFN